MKKLRKDGVNRWSNAVGKVKGQKRGTRGNVFALSGRIWGMPFTQGAALGCALNALSGRIKKASAFNICRNFAYLFVIVSIATAIYGCGQKSNPLKQKAATKPWADVDSTAQIEADSLAMAEADSLAKVDSVARADSLVLADSIARAEAATASHQTLRGTIGEKEVLLRFSTINGTQVMGNGMIGNKVMEISGQYADTARTALTLDEMSRERDHPTLHMQMQATADGFQGTYVRGTEKGSVTLKRDY